MSEQQCKKAAIDCTGYRCEMDNRVDLIVAQIETDEGIIDEFIKLQGDQEKMWLKFTEKHYGF